jgi:hypothetical protein
VVPTPVDVELPVEAAVSLPYASTVIFAVIYEPGVTAVVAKSNTGFPATPVGFVIVILELAAEVKDLAANVPVVVVDDKKPLAKPDKAILSGRVAVSLVCVINVASFGAAPLFMSYHVTPSLYIGIESVVLYLNPPANGVGSWEFVPEGRPIAELLENVVKPLPFGVIVKLTVASEPSVFIPTALPDMLL